MVCLTYMKIVSGPLGFLEDEVRECFADNGYIDDIAERKNADSARASLSALLLLYKTLEYADQSCSSISLKKDENGRPYIENEEEIDFSISHSGEYVACALSVREGSVGVDVEKNDPERRFMLIANRMFSEGEICEFEDAGETSTKFTEIWTRKEAYFKFLGNSKVLPDTDGANVSFEKYKIGDYCLTLCRKSCGDMTYFEQM